MKKFILNADDLGKSEFHNNAILNGFKKRLLKSASLMTNMEFYDDAVYRVVKPYNDKSIGIHLNLVEGKSIGNNLFYLTDEENNFNNSFLKLLLKSSNNEFLKQVEYEFRLQIERGLSQFNPTHLDSHVHTHSIPNIFKIVVKLAKEYNIKQIRTQNEIPYFVFSKKYNLKTYLLNQIKVYLLKYFTILNKNYLKNQNINSNDFLIGVSYTSMMDTKSLFEGLKKIKNKENIIIEALIHPCFYDNDKIVNSHTEEYSITQDEKLVEDIEKLGFLISNYI